MKQIKCILVLLIIGLVITAHSQNLADTITLYNGALQPNPMRGDVLLKSELIPTSQSLALQLPSEVSNDTSRFFPPIFHQVGLSCVHAAEIGYTFTYEMNRLRSVDAGSSWDNLEPNLFPHLYSFNFVNGGYGFDEGTPVYSGFEIVLSNGCPMYNDWYDPQGVSSDVYWMDGYEKYHRGMSNRVVEVKTITLNNNDASIDKLKHWLYDHAEASNTGGLAVVCVYTDGWKTDGRLPQQSSHYNEFVIRKLGNGVGNPPPAHAMTIVGYDDNVCYDINEDGIITTTIDINGDGIVNVYDSEYGAFKIANSSATWFGNNGFIWLPYSLLDEIMPIDYVRKVYVCEVEERDVQLTYKATIKHSHRGHLALYVGYSPYVASSIPLVKDTFNIFNNQGGENIPMHGIDQNPIEIGLDFSSKYPNLTSYKKYFLQAVDNNTNAGNYSEGECFIQNFSLMDYRWGEAFELPCPTTNIPIGKNATTTLSINYDLLPFDGTPLPTNWNSDKVARRTVNVGSNTQIGDDVNLDMYGTDLFDCIIFIKSNTTLTIGDGVTFTAKRGTCKIVVEGNLVLGENVRFCTENGATLELDFSVAQSVSSFVGTTFQNCDLRLPPKNLSFLGCVFTETPLRMDNQNAVHGLAAVIEGCSFVSTSSQFDKAVYLNYYDSFLIKNNTINGNGSRFANGIVVMNCGNSNILNPKRISDNNIMNCTYAGLEFYASSGEIMYNKITGNKVGVQLLNNSNVWRFTGKCNASDSQDTQYIHDNENFEVRITRNCIPSEIRYNTICALATHPYIKYEDNTLTALNIDITYNYWGGGSNYNSYFVSTNPNVSFTYFPLWPVGLCVNQRLMDAQDMVVLADSLSTIGANNEAKSVYKQLVNLYPSTVEAQVALKTLFNLECVSGLDFNGLKSYYLNDTVIAGNHNLNKLASSLSNRCNKVMRRYDDAIMWYESVLLDTLSTFNDSIFAAIDLGNLYLRMEAMGEKGVGKLTQYIPVSREAYEKQVSYALSLLSYSRQDSEEYPIDYWIDVVTEQPEGYETDGQGNVTISTAEGLAWFAAVVNGRNGQEAHDFEGKEVKLVSDIDMGAHLWEAIGNSYFDDSICFDYIQRFFKGSFDGGKHEISNLIHGYRGYYRMPDPYGYEKYQGLFGNMTNASVSNLRMKDFVCLNDLEDGLHFGSVAAVAEESVIDRCYSKGSLLPEDHFFGGKGIPAGGIAYRSINSRISNCVFVADSCISIQMGGIVHDNFTTDENRCSEVSNCYMFGRIIDYVDDPLKIGYSAGIVHANKADSGIEKGSIVRNCYYYPVSPGNDLVGHRKAIACSNYTGCTIENCYYLAVDNVNFYSGVCGDNGGIVRNVSAFNGMDNSCVLEDPVEIGGEMVDDLKEALNRWVAVQQNSADYENWCDDEWMEQGGAPLLCAIYETIEEETEDLSQITISPNPSSGFFHIKGVEVAELRAYNALGQLVKTTQNTNEIDMGSMPKGLYMIKIHSTDGLLHVGKVVVSK